MPLFHSGSNSSDYYDDEYDSTFLETLETMVLPGDEARNNSDDSQELEPPPPSQPALKRRYTAVEDRSTDEATSHQIQATHDDDIYGASHFGEFGEYMQRKRAKLQIQNAELQESSEYTDGRSKIFQGLAIYINGWTEPSVQDLRQLIVKHGGIFHPYLDKKTLVTHIVTCSLTPAKTREFKHMKVVRPEWLVKSLEAGVLLPWKDFMYTPNERSEGSQGTKTKQRSLFDASEHPKTPTHGARTRITSIPELLNIADNQATEEASAVPMYAAHTSNPHAERAMANSEWRKAHTSAAPDFIERYYKNSRLHHLSAWKAELKNLVQEAQERAEAGGDGVVPVGKIDSELALGERDGLSMRGAEFVMRLAYKGKGRTKAIDDRVIMHCDFDCFFVSAGLVSRPHLKGKPVVVCHSQGSQGGSSSTSEIASASYEARKFGVKNGMSLQQARQLCPTILTIPYEFERYKQFSLQFYTILMAHADDLQAVSVDEALIDVTSTVTQLQSRGSGDPSPADPAVDFAEAIRAQVRKATGCEVSIGISHNILLARLATRRAKPAGSYHLVPSEVSEFLAPLDIADLHGFGSSTKQKAQEKFAVTTLGELMSKSKGVLCDALGKSTGETLYNVLRGIDDKKLDSDKPRKSVSCEINYGIRFENAEQAKAFIYQMATEVTKRLNDIGMLGRSITLKVMTRDPTAPIEPPKFLGHGRCDLFNKQIPLLGPGGRATNDEKTIGEHAWRLLRTFNFDPKELRGLGIHIQKLENHSGLNNTHLGQAVLPFRRVESPTKLVLSLPDPAEGPHSPPQSNDMVTEAPGVPLKDSDHTDSSITVDLPSFSQIDMTVFDALPLDVRKELENEYQHRLASPPIDKAPHHSPAALPAGHATPLPIFPHNKITVKGTNFKRITHQLAPRSHSSIPLQKSMPFKGKHRGPSVRMSDGDLRELGIDPEVFAMLPPNVQREQLVMARLIKTKGAIPEPPSQLKVLKPRKPSRIPAHRLWRAPAPKARYLQPPLLRQQGKAKREKLYFTETDDIQRVIESWVTGYRHWPPKAKDIEFFTKYLVESVDGRKSTDVGVDRAVAIVKWWLVLLRRYWGGSELVEEEGVDSSQHDPVGKAWWQAFRDVKEKMDVVARRKFGGRLSLR